MVLQEFYINLIVSACVGVAALVCISIFNREKYKTNQELWYSNEEWLFHRCKVIRSTNKGYLIMTEDGATHDVHENRLHDIRSNLDEDFRLKTIKDNSL